jgi:hypothetical protein
MRKLVEYNERERILWVTFTPKMTPADLQEYYDENTKVLETISAKNQKIVIIADMTSLIPRFPNYDERVVIKQNIARYKPYVEREAIFGLQHYIRTFTNALFAFVGRKDMKLFEDEQTAMSWLKESPVFSEMVKA